MKAFDRANGSRSPLPLLLQSSKKPGLLSISPSRLTQLSHGSVSPMSRAKNISPISSASPFRSHKSLKLGFDLLYKITGRETRLSSQRQTRKEDNQVRTESCHEVKQVTVVKKRETKRKVHFVKLNYLHKNKRLLEKIRERLTKTMTVQETNKPPVLSDVERLALHADMPPRGRTRTIQQSLLEATPTNDSVIEAVESETVHLPPVHVSPTPRTRLMCTNAKTVPMRRIADIPINPFGKHRPVPGKVPVFLLDPMKLKIRQKQAMIKRLFEEHEENTTDL